MDQLVRDRVGRVVRSLVKKAYGAPTCIGSVKVLAAVLKEGWGIDLSLHMVSLKIIPSRVLEILSKTELTLDEQRAAIQKLPDGEKPKAIVSGDGQLKFHVVGISGSESLSILWDPSIDQVNSVFDTCKFDPLSVPMSERLPNDPENIVFIVNGCTLGYRVHVELEKVVHACDAWSMDYSAITKAALFELKDLAMTNSRGLGVR